MQKKDRRKSFYRGIRSEKWAAWWLRLKGFRIVARRFKTKSGEIDLIARRGNLVLIVEVKARATLADAMVAVCRMNERRIEAAADVWLAQQKDYSALCVRFDFIAILPWRLPHHIPRFFESHQ
ncbi:TIGR00252 family protein [Bartonella bacilliformis str. Heidi Mejia]|uniref:YraN family protein n=1 Tax=Bartonella bacilliformis TaxID=774 RepID=UPI000449B611|nr:YraN family protein [Bartonella bacilliformis]EYS92540.1 TIGR00252 family protein [Bartonella bacilliformis str. Heidi Mejia]KEG17090.1 TIGR00252 family protein [Bartonella bacilliformis Cond044]KEG19169.1 TIGR00252 family protein [Bartonella bacilliformis Hosp800-02]KEG20293.1 TIGR00252 family protein [Bartonella bacilliformis Peru38]KEG22370.1 TIGR00252 family protein [Bartonella bacilliformis VAB9028]